MYRSPPDIYRISVRSSSTLEGVLSSRLVCCRLVLSLSSRLLVSISGVAPSRHSTNPPSLSPLVVLSLSLYIRRAKVELNSLGSNLLTTELLRFITVLSEYRFTRTEQSKNNRALFYYATP